MNEDNSQRLFRELPNLYRHAGTQLADDLRILLRGWMVFIAVQIVERH